ncbi:MAG: hemerythrin family protein [Methylococcales bacterium]|nr:hemerythrin family protein [Methylococcales bacterium]
MALITWNVEQHETNVNFADDEHKVLFDKLNKVYDSAISGVERGEVGVQLDDLVAYVVEHFAHEEKEMKEKNYTGFEAHKAQHDALVGICAGLQAKFHAGEAEVTEEVGQMVKGWLDSHIPAFDMPYADVLNS